MKKNLKTVSKLFAFFLLFCTTNTFSSIASLLFYWQQLMSGNRVLLVYWALSSTADQMMGRLKLQSQCWVNMNFLSFKYRAQRLAKLKS